MGVIQMVGVGLGAIVLLIIGVVGFSCMRMSGSESKREDSYDNPDKIIVNDHEDIHTEE